MKFKTSQSCSLRNRLSKLLFDAALSDVTFLVGDPPRTFHCHKLILATGSKAFKAMLFGKMAEISEISIPDITSKAFENILRYLYTDEVILEDEADAIQTAYGAKKYLMKDLFDACEDYLSSEATLNFQSVFLLHEEASFLEMRKLRRRCLLYVSRNAHELFASLSFLSASLDTLRDVLHMDFLQLDSETEIIQAIWSWGVERCKERRVKHTNENVRNVTIDLRKYIRFLSLKTEELEHVFERYPFLDESEQLAVLWNIAMPSKVEKGKMPSNLCGTFRKRSFNNLFVVKIPAEYRYGCEIIDFSAKQFERKIKMKTEGPGVVVVVGVVVETKLISCYYTPHRQLDVEIVACNETTNFSTLAKLCQRASGREFVFLEDFVVFLAGDVGQFTFKIKAEGVKLMECRQREFSRKIEDSLVTFSFVDYTSDQILFPIKEIMCLPEFF